MKQQTIMQRPEAPATIPDAVTRRPLLVGVTGGACAGKTTFVKRLAKALALRQKVNLVDLDSYKNRVCSSHDAQTYPHSLNHRESYDLFRFYDDLSRLRQGDSILTPAYDFKLQSLCTGTSMTGDVVIAEGSMLFLDEKISALFDVKVFIDTPADVRLRRCLERDVREHGRTLMQAIDHYMTSVLPLYEHFVEPSRDICDYVVHGMGDNGFMPAELADAMCRDRTQNVNVFHSLNSQHGTS